MTLSCDCEYDPEPGDTIWWPPRDFSTYTGRRKVKCCSCHDKIASGDLCGEFFRDKIAEGEIEERIYGENGHVPRASWYMCEKCTGLYFSLYDLGFCVNISDDMRTLVKEYAQLKNR